MQSGYLIPLKQLVGSDREDKGTLVSDQSLFGQLSLPARSDPQGAGERRYDDGRQRGDGPIVFFNKLSRATTVGEDSATESGWIFFGGVFFVGLMVPLYAALKCWRERSLTRYKGGQKKRKKE